VSHVTRHGRGVEYAVVWYGPTPTPTLLEAEAPLALLADALTTAFLRSAFLARNGLDLTRRVSPVLAFGDTIVVTGFGRVQEVFERPRDFINGPVYGPKLKLGALILGMDISARYERERRGLQCAFERVATSFASCVEASTQEVLKALPSGRIDLVTEVIEPVFARALATVFGIRPHLATSRVLQASSGEKTFIHWLRKLGGLIASGVPAPFGLDALTETLAQEMRAFLQNEIDAGAAGPTSVLGMLTGRKQVEDMVGAIGGSLTAGATLFKAAALAARQLVAHPRALEEAMASARGANHDAVRQYLWEALRFQPPFPLLVRYCPRETVLAQTVVRAGATVLVSPLAAMFDPSAFPNPARFSPHRPIESYLLFGRGSHECAALQLASQGLPSFFVALLQHTPMLRARGPIRYDGPAVASYPVEFAGNLAVGMPISPIAARPIPPPPPGTGDGPLPPHVPKVTIDEAERYNNRDSTGEYIRGELERDGRVSKEEEPRAPSTRTGGGRQAG
jgi:cytochrome P450